MKKLTVLLVSLFICMGLSAQNQKGVNFENLTFKQALAKVKSNKKGPKLVFMDCYTVWCGPCKYMTENIFPQEAAGEFFNANFVNIKIDMEKGEGIDLAKEYKISAYPTFLILDGDGKEIGRVIGGGDLDKFIQRVDVFINPAKSPDVLKAAFNGEKTLQNAAAYMDALSYTGKQNEAIKFVDENFDSFDKMDIFNEKYWPYISQGMSADNSRILKFVIENKSVYNNNVGKQKIDKALISVCQNEIISYLSGKKSMSKDRVNNITASLSLLSDGNDVDNFHIILANYYANNEMDKITGLFHLGAFMYSTTDMQKEQIERIFISVKDMPQSKIREYYENKAKIYRANADSFEKRAERYKE